MEVAVLIATYNSGSYLEELLNSLLNQSFKDFTCYVHDDGSDDTTMEILRNYAERTSLSINIMDYPSTGSAKANFISMLSFVEEPYVMFCDHDDVWLPDKISKSVRAIKSLEADNAPSLVFTDLKVVDEKLNTISESFMQFTGINPSRVELNNLLLENVAAGCTMIANKSLYSLARRITSADHIPMHDHWIILVAAATGNIYFLNESTILYRQHNNNELGAIKNKNLLERAHVVGKRILQQEYKKSLRDWINLRQLQAQELLKITDLPIKNRRLLQGFCDVKRKNKIKRICFYLQNDIRRSRYNIWFLLNC